jgi:hypothetical protein
VQADLAAAVLDDPTEPEPKTCATGRGLRDGDHRWGPFGGTYRVALMMGDGGARDSRRLAARASGRSRADVRGGRVRRRTIKFTAHWN